MSRHHHGLSPDAAGDWVAELAVRTLPAHAASAAAGSRPWVTSEAGRSAKLGASIECATCRMPELPARASEYKRTATFTEETVPGGLLRDHRTKPGVWAKIVVETGRLAYTLESPRRTFMLTPEYPGVVPPTNRTTWSPPAPCVSTSRFCQPMLAGRSAGGKAISRLSRSSSRS